jgi:hypothetical protein
MAAGDDGLRTSNFSYTTNFMAAQPNFMARQQSNLSVCRFRIRGALRFPSLLTAGLTN